MKCLMPLILLYVSVCWSIPKPMEAVANYNVIMVHGAYGSDKGIEDCSDSFAVEAALATGYLSTSEDAANIGYYDDRGRLTNWLDSLMFEDYLYGEDGKHHIDEDHNQTSPYIYSWRAFVNPANSSINNAHELGDRTWHNCGKRRALIEEAQEMRAVVDDSIRGQAALGIIRGNPDLYRQIPSRYILIGHSMGGIASREWIQNSDYYYGEVDKVITLDSPHEGTGALNAQLRLKDPYVIAQMADNTLAYGGVTFGLAALPMVPGPSKAILYTYATLSSLLLIAPPFIEPLLESDVMDNKLQNYSPEDPLVAYLDPSKSGDDHIDVLKGIGPHDSLPMFRLMGGTSSMTFTDLNEDYPADVLGWLIPNAYVASFGNLYHHWGWDKVSFSNAMTGAVLGLGGNLAVWNHGTALVSESSGMAEHTESLISPLVDVKRFQFMAAKNVKEQEDWVTPVMGIVDGVAVACMAVGAVLVWNEALRIAGEIALGVGGLAALGAYATSSIWSGGLNDLGDSHLMPLYKKNQNTWHADYSNTVSPIAGSSVNDTTINPLIMEDFLYERPFVNLAMLDLHTLDTIQNAGVRAESSFGFILDSLGKLPDSLKKDVDTLLIQGSLLEAERKSVASLNRNCYYLGSDNSVNCAVGLFYKADDLTSAIQKPVSALGELKFKSESDWSKMGVKVDRWEKVDGLTPEGKDTSDYVPIRHVERYKVPDITVYDWINKYSFVVDDLMPHRLRQIRMNFNFQEEIASRYT